MLNPFHEGQRQKDSKLRERKRKQHNESNLSGWRLLTRQNEHGSKSTEPLHPTLFQLTYPFILERWEKKQENLLTSTVVWHPYFRNWNFRRENFQYLWKSFWLRTSHWHLTKKVVRVLLVDVADEHGDEIRIEKGMAGGKGEVSKIPDSSQKV